MLIKKIAGTGAINFAGDLGDATSSALHSPKGLAMDSGGNIYIADSGNQRIRVISGWSPVVRSGTPGPSPAPVESQISTLAGCSTRGRKDLLNPNDATSAFFNYPSGIALDSSGFVYVADTNNHAIRVIYPNKQPNATGDFLVGLYAGKSC
jgi:DNA-binding beta-propeller fold protein YncE